jgi:DNA polymerase III alpha subunit
MMKYANLHLHSTYSDAQFTPEQLVLIGKSLGYYALALTDHETDGGVKKFMAYAKKEGLRSVSGVEFYGKNFGYNFHLTALDFDMENPGIRAFIQNRCDLHMESTRKIFEEGIRIGQAKQRKKVMQLTVEGELVQIWDSLTQAAKENGMDISSICQCCKGTIKTAGGYIWKYSDDST